MISCNYYSIVFSHHVIILLVIRSVSDVLRTQSRFVKFVRVCVGGGGVEAAYQTRHILQNLLWVRKYVRHRSYN